MAKGQLSRIPWPGNLSVRGFFQSTVQPYQSTKMTLERAASHIKVTFNRFAMMYYFIGVIGSSFACNLLCKD